MLVKVKQVELTINSTQYTCPPEEGRRIFLKQNLTDEEARRHEVYMIAVLGRKDLGTSILRNRTAGGEGCAGRVLSEETKNKLSAAHKGRKKSEAHRKALSEAHKGKTKSSKWLESMKGKNAGKKNPAYGKKWWNNGIESKLCKECPGEGYKLGHCIRRKIDNK